MKIIAIGGGGLHDPKCSIEKQTIKLAGKKKPHVLFIPTASSDDSDYIKAFQKVYQKKLNCSTNILLLIKDRPTIKEIRKMINAADIIFVGGGNTLMMMKLWQHLGVDKMLVKACKNEKVLTGSSAGALCWFNYGHSDSWFYYKYKKPVYVRVKCLGFVKTMLCPHFHGEKRVRDYENMIKKFRTSGIALDDYAAIEIVDNKYRIITGKKSAKAFHICYQNRKITSKIIKQNVKFQPLSNLIN